MRILFAEPRGCGEMKEGGTYLMGEPVENGVLRCWTPIEPVVPAEVPPRGWQYIDFDALLRGKPQDEWLLGVSQESHDRARERAEALEGWEVM